MSVGIHRFIEVKDKNGWNLVQWKRVQKYYIMDDDKDNSGEMEGVYEIENNPSVLRDSYIYGPCYPKSLSDMGVPDDMSAEAQKIISDAKDCKFNVGYTYYTLKDLEVELDKVKREYQETQHCIDERNFLEKLRIINGTRRDCDAGEEYREHIMGLEDMLNERNEKIEALHSEIVTIRTLVDNCSPYRSDLEEGIRVIAYFDV